MSQVRYNWNFQLISFTYRTFADVQLEFNVFSGSSSVLSPFWGSAEQDWKEEPLEKKGKSHGGPHVKSDGYLFIPSLLTQLVPWCESSWLCENGCSLLKIILKLNSYFILKKYQNQISIKSFQFNILYLSLTQLKPVNTRFRHSSLQVYFLHV